jgi:hypothetical protein
LTSCQFRRAKHETVRLTIQRTVYCVADVGFPLFPLLSTEDKAESSEGGIDPLGLYAVAEALAVRLVPGVRERQAHPRYLTAMAVGLEVCRAFPEECVAGDGVSGPWLVFEWLLVEGFARTADGTRDPFNLPGRLKAADAMRDGMPLSARRYLKTPSVFGFHGIYRLLARELGVEQAGRLGETGHALLCAWAREQGLEGFCGSGGGPGEKAREQIYWAVRESLPAGACARREGWSGWSFFRAHLSPHQAGPAEAAVLRDALLAERGGHRASVLRFLASTKGRKAFEAAGSERQFHAALRAQADPELGALLDAIAIYETFARLCQDAFDDALFEMTRSGSRKTTPRDLARLQSVQAAARRIPELSGEVLEKLPPARERARFAETFAALAERGSAVDWAERLLLHHLRIQRQKPPAGKSPWFERYDDGGVLIRPLYRRERGGAGDSDRYVHAYRTKSLYSFAHDLQMFPT